MLRQTGGRRRCPECAELVRREATRCRFCNAQLEPSNEPSAPSLYPALFNLSGLGLGYLALRLGTRAAVAAAGTAVLVLVALFTANIQPLLVAGLFIGWFLLTTFDAVRLAAAGAAGLSAHPGSSCL